MSQLEGTKSPLRDINRMLRYSLNVLTLLTTQNSEWKLQLSYTYTSFSYNASWKCY